MTALSDVVQEADLHKLYLQLDELFKIGSMEGKEGLLYYEALRNRKSSMTKIVDYERIGNSSDYGDLLFEVYLVLIKANLQGFNRLQKKEVFNWIRKVLYGEELSIASLSEQENQSDWDLVEELTNQLAVDKKLVLGDSKEEVYVRTGLLSMYHFLEKPDLGIRFLVKEVLYINEDYFGKIFSRIRNEKFSTYLSNVRVELAKRLWQYDENLKVSQVAELIGFVADGQYFSKVFHKYTGMSPSSYKEYIAEGRKKDKEI
jgi:two-component system response regulator YesN